MDKKSLKLPLIGLFVGFVLLPVFLMYGCATFFFASINVTLSANPVSGKAPLTVTFIGTGESSDYSRNRPSSYSFYSTKEGAVILGNFPTGVYNVTLLATYETPGTYEAKLYVNYSQGEQKSATVEVTVLPQ